MNESATRGFTQSGERVFLVLLILLAVVCMVFHFLDGTRGEIFQYITAFPFALIGRGLRWLSLSGWVGNIAAWVIYLKFCLSPLDALFLLNRKRGFKPEDVLLVVLSILLFAVMYFMVNPGAMPGVLLMVPRWVGFMLLGSTVWSVVGGFVVLQLLRWYFTAGDGVLLKHIQGLFYILAALFVLAVFGNRFGIMLAALKGVPGFDALFVVLRYFVSVLPYLLNIWVVFAVQRLVLTLSEGIFNEKGTHAAREMSRTCGKVLAVSVLAVLVFNLLQLLFVGNLHNIHIELVFPLEPMLITLGALLFARYMVLGKDLKDENEGFV
jgi:hypothetical protein